MYCECCGKARRTYLHRLQRTHPSRYRYHGLPDLAMTTLGDVCEDIRRITYVSELPLLVDADTGWGSSSNDINSVDTPRDLRLQVWNRLAGDLKPQHLERISAQLISFDELPNVFQAYLDGKVTGRTVVRVGHS